MRKLEWNLLKNELNPYTRERENSGGDAFDISWAIDENNNYVDLDEIDFVKVQSAVLADGGWIGEISTEIAGAIDIEPDASINGTESIVVVKDLPKEIHDPAPALWKKCSGDYRRSAR